MGVAGKYSLVLRFFAFWFSVDGVVCAGFIFRSVWSGGNVQRGGMARVS